MTQRGAARAGYRLGVCDTMIAAVSSGEMELPGLFLRAVEGEREFRIQELSEQGVTLDDLKDMAITPKSSSPKKRKAE